NGLPAGTYSCTVLDANNCMAPIPTVTITSPPALIIDTLFSTPTKCGVNKGTATISVSGGTPPYAYSWSPVTGTNTSITNLQGGTVYTCTITDKNKCVNNVSVLVADTGGPRDTVMPNSTINCYGDKTGSAIVSVISGAAPFVYSWSPSGGTNSFAINLGAGTYTCTVTDKTKCQGQATITFTQPPQVTSVINTIGVCHNASAGGSAIINVSGGVPPYSYLWSNSVTATNDSIANIGPGAYICTVTDANSCKVNFTCNITTTAILQIDSIVAYPTSCRGCSDGWVQVYPSGGIPQGDSLYYLYVWDNIANTSSIHNVDTGVYHVCVTTNFCPNESICDSAVVIAGITSVNSLYDNIKIYPVPSRGMVNIELSAGMLNASLTISDELGNIVWTQNINSVNKNGVISVDMGQMPNGVYMARIVNGKGVAVKKIVIQK
ncbi:MAG TPA: T9SS type A sorting domain-containing protein, partial [Bacteroidia bacterium]|nr:T9SS type A sorting domain-containing protein [Bacteroidia bacterium]